MARISRTPPKPPFWEADPGTCRGCGLELLTSKGAAHKGRRWCGECREGWRIASHPTRARAAVFIRDMGICNDCGLDCTSYEVESAEVFGTYRVQINRGRAFDWCQRMLGKAENPKNPQSEYAIDLGDWHVDHAMPLHLIDREKPDAWREWTLPNLRTRCPSCHQEKTTQEAKDRGKVRRLNGTTKKKSGRKIPQRANPWPKKSELAEGSQIVTPDKPWLTEGSRLGHIAEAAETAAAMSREMVRVKAQNEELAGYLEATARKRNKIQAAHQDPPKRTPEPNKLKGRGFGK